MTRNQLEEIRDRHKAVSRGKWTPAYIEKSIVAVKENEK